MALIAESSEDVSRGELDFDRLVAAVLAGELEAYRKIIGLGEVKVRVVLAAILPDRERVECGAGRARGQI